MDKAKLAGLEAAIERFYGQAPVSSRLIEAIRYSIEAGGKRIRPLFLLEMLEAFGLPLTNAHFEVAASLELIHTGSLIHDDLPAMDDDDYRRGRLTNHRQFDEATAILAGDSLFLDPFGLLAQADLPAAVKVELIGLLSRASGTFGMVAGQALDMAGEGQDLTLDQLQTIHAHKTGCLLAFPFEAAAILAEQADQVRQVCRKAGDLVGLAFQIRDDILDVTATFEDLGKTPQKDLAAAKSTYPNLMGLETSKAYLDTCLDQAVAIFQDLEKSQGFKPERICQLIERLRLDA